MVSYRNKNCELCGKDYTPTSPKQKYCSTCKDSGRKIADRVRDRERSRSKNNYKEFTRTCPSCGIEFTTHYSKKVYCGAADCELCRIYVKNKKIHLNRDKQYLIDKGRHYYKENKDLCCLKKAEAYREAHPNAKEYLPGRVYIHSIDYVREYVNSYDYTLLSTNYVNNREKIKLICPNGHEWETSFHNFKDCGNRCAVCYQQNNYISKPELKIRELFENEFSDIEVLYNDRSQIGPKELDLYIPKYRLAIEVCGLYWHSDTANNTPRNYHYQKMIECEKVGIKLLTLFEDEIINKFDLVKSLIVQALGRTNKFIYGGKYTIQEVPKQVAIDFFNNNHIQGYCQAKTTFGLYYKNVLVSAVSVDNNLDKTLELKRFCSLKCTEFINDLCILFKYLLNYAALNNCDNIKTSCDMRYSCVFKSTYDILGFKVFKSTKYTSYYFKGGVRYKNIPLKKTPEELAVGKTQSELRLAQGYNRIWDCGHTTYLYTLN